MNGNWPLFAERSGRLVYLPQEVDAMNGLRCSVGLAVLCLLVACGGGGGGGADDPTPIEVTSAAAAGPGTLAEAIAMADPGATITFGAGVTGTIRVPAGGLIVDRPLTIQGPSGGGLALSGGSASRVIEVTPAGNLTLEDILIEDAIEESGAGIRNAGTLTLNRVQLVNCEATGFGRGGGIQNFGTATLTDCTIENCTGYNGAGFVNDEGTLTLRRCLVTNNMTSGNSGAGGTNSDGTLILVNCTFDTNETTGGNRAGGGLAIFVDDVGSETTILHCTFANNTATGPGGGIFCEGDLGPPAFPSLVRIEGTIVADNTSGSGGPDCDFVTPGVILTTARNNVIGIDTNSLLVNGVAGNQVGSAGTPLDPLLGALADNGGATFSRLPGAGSVARDAVPTPECVDVSGAPLTRDQRDSARPVGGACDVGAVEGL